MRISVIIAAHNAAGTLGLAVASSAWQTLPPHEIIVVDDGSVDGTAAVARAAGAICLSQPRRGVAAARNAAVRHASGDWVAVLDADDVWLPQRLERSAAVLGARRQPCVLGPDAWVWREPEDLRTALARRESVFHDLCRLDLGLPPAQAVYRNAPIMHPLFPRAALLAEPYDEDLRVYEDTELVWRLVACGLEMVFLNEPLGFYRVGCASLTRVQTPQEVCARRLLMLERALLRCGHNDQAAGAIRRDIAACRRWQALMAFMDDVRAHRLGPGLRGFTPWMAWWAARHALERSMHTGHHSAI